jgi:polyisoprenoid-binding protein YceI
MTQGTLAAAGTGIETPSPGIWAIDPAHTSVSFVARHLMVAKVRGFFKGVSGSVTVAERPEDSSVEVSIPAATIDTANETRDAHLRSPDFLDVENYPALYFRSTKLEQTGEGEFRMHGDLTIRDVTRPVVLDVTYEGLARDPYGNEKAAFTATGEIDREEWGITWNQVLETGGVLVGKKVRIELDVEIVKQP